MDEIFLLFHTSTPHSSTFGYDDMSECESMARRKGKTKAFRKCALRVSFLPPSPIRLAAMSVATIVARLEGGSDRHSIVIAIILHQRTLPK